MNARDRAMLAHPAGKGMPESAEVRQARLDAEACELGSTNHPVTRPSWWHNIIAPALIVATMFAGITLAPTLSDLGTVIA